MENQSPWEDPSAQPARPAIQPTKNTSPSTNAVIALCLGIGSWVLGFSLMMSVPGFFIARQELAAIKKGDSNPESEGFAKAGYWLSLTNVIASILGLLAFIAFFLFFFGFAFLGAAANQM